MFPHAAGRQAAYQGVHVCMFNVCMYVCLMCACMYVYVYTCLLTWFGVKRHMHVCMYVYVYICLLT